MKKELAIALYDEKGKIARIKVELDEGEYPKPSALELPTGWGHDLHIADDTPPAGRWGSGLA